MKHREQTKKMQRKTRLAAAILNCCEVLGVSVCGSAHGFAHGP